MMTPYYADDFVTLYHGDCREVLSGIGGVDVILTDPPFFMPAQHYQSRVGWRRTWGDTSILRIFWSVVVDEALPALKRTGHMLTFCDDESYPVFFPVMYGHFDYMKSIVWDKGHVGLGRVWRSQHELVIAARWDSSIFPNDKPRSDVVRHRATPPADRSHPVEKPTSLLRDLLEPTCPVGGLVLDPFAGSGTTLFAAKSMGARAIGIEIEERYCEIAAERCRQEVLDFGDASLGAGARDGAA